MRKGRKKTMTIEMSVGELREFLVTQSFLIANGVTKILNATTATKIQRTTKIDPEVQGIIEDMQRLSAPYGIEASGTHERIFRVLGAHIYY